MPEVVMDPAVLAHSIVGELGTQARLHIKPRTPNSYNLTPLPL